MQNDGFLSRDRGRGRDSDLADILIGIPLKDDHNDQPTVQARQHRGGVAVQVPGRSGLRQGGVGDMTFLEIGMYVLMTAFCFAIVIFMVTCFVYASKFRPVASGVADLHDTSLDAIGSGLGGMKILREPRKNRESTQNAHDWVWLGRSTVDRTSMNVDQNGSVGSAVGGNQRGTF